MKNDLGVKIGTREEVLWTEIRDQSKQELDKLEDNYFRAKTFQQAVMLMAEKKIYEEERKRKK